MLRVWNLNICSNFPRIFRRLLALDFDESRREVTTRYTRDENNAKKAAEARAKSQRYRNVDPEQPHAQNKHAGSCQLLSSRLQYCIVAISPREGTVSLSGLCTETLPPVSYIPKSQIKSPLLLIDLPAPPRT